MILGNKCDMTDRRQVSKDRGEKVRRFSQSGAGVNLRLIILINFLLPSPSAGYRLWSEVHGNQRKVQLKRRRGRLKC